MNTWARKLGLMVRDGGSPGQEVCVRSDTFENMVWSGLSLRKDIYQRVVELEMSKRERCWEKHRSNSISAP